MKFFSIVKEVFHQDNIIITERLDTVEASLTVPFSNFPDFSIFRSLCELIPDRDILTITLSNESENIIRVSNRLNTLPDFSQITSGCEYDDCIYINFQIDKNVSENSFSIYDFSSFSKDLLQRSDIEILSWFSKKLRDLEKLKFYIFDNDVSFSTRTLIFESNEEFTFVNKIDRSQRIMSCKDVSNFYNMDRIEVIPDDFIIEGIIRSGNNIKELFDRLSTILSLVYVATSASLSKEMLHVQISGYRLISFDLVLDEIQADEKWKTIYSWVYTDGNVVDKALIARNVISLHCKFTPLLHLDNTVYEAIRTNYNLYLKENIKHYLDLKRDISKFVQDIVTQINDYELSILGHFKANLIAIFGFLFTVVLTKIGETQSWSEIFTLHTLYLIEIFVIGSVAYLMICIAEICHKLKKPGKDIIILKKTMRKYYLKLK